MKTLSISLAATIALLGGACEPTAVKGTPTPEAKAPPPTPMTLPELLSTLPLDLIDAADKPQVIVLGENHAKVETQRHLLTTLTRLHETGHLAKVLVEGTKGSIDVAAIRDSLAEIKADDAYWEREVAEGRLDGYECFALRNQRVPLIGVEDMREKARFEFLGLHSTQSIADTHAEFGADALAAARGAAAALAAKLDPERAAEVARLVADLETKVSAADGAFAARIKLEAASGALALREQWVDKFVPVTEMLDEATPVFEKLRAATEGDPDKMVTAWMSLTEGERATMDRFMKARDELDEVEAKLEKRKASKKEAHSDEAVVAATTAVSDTFALTSNRLLALAAEAKLEIPEVADFYPRRSEAERKKDPRVPRPDLDARDRALVAGTREHLAEGEVVVLIVGYAHLGGVARYLREAGVPFVSAVVQGSTEETEPWEDMAWERRRPGGEGVFADVRAGLKNKPSITSKPWIEDKRRAATILDKIQREELQPSFTWGDARVYKLASAATGKERSDVVLRIGGPPIDRNARFGPHLRDRIPVPGRPGEYAYVFDRKAGRAQVDELSDDSTAFAYGYQVERGDTAEYRVYTKAQGERSLDDFAETAPGGGGGGKEPPEDVVLTAEPDGVRGGGGHTSRLRQRLAADVPPGDPPSSGRAWTAFGAGARMKGPRLHRTNNPARAKDNLKALKKQNPALYGKVEIIDLTQPGARLKLSTSDGVNAQVTVIIAKNVPELIALVRAAAARGECRHKQFILLICNDAVERVDEIREVMFDGGARMIFNPGGQLTPEAAFAAAGVIQELAQGMSDAERVDIHALMSTVFARDPGLRQRLGDGETWTRILSPRAGERAVWLPLPWERPLGPEPDPRKV